MPEPSFCSTVSGCSHGFLFIVISIILCLVGENCPEGLCFCGQKKESLSLRSGDVQLTDRKGAGMR